MRVNLAWFGLFTSMLLSGCGGSSGSSDGQQLTSYRPTVIEYDINNDGTVDYQDIYTYDEQGKLISITGSGSIFPPSEAFPQFQVAAFSSSMARLDPSLIIDSEDSLDPFLLASEEGAYTSSINYSYDDQGRVTDINTETFLSELSVSRIEYSLTWSTQGQVISVMSSRFGFDGALLVGGVSDLIYSNGLIVESPGGALFQERTYMI